MTIGITTAQRNARLQVIATAIDAGTAAATLKIYDGTRPATGGAVTTLLGTFTLAYPTPAPSAGAITFSNPADVTAVATGTASWARISDSTGAFVADLSVATASADIIVNSTSISSGQTLKVTSAVINEGNA